MPQTWRLTLQELMKLIKSIMTQHQNKSEITLSLDSERKQLSETLLVVSGLVTQIPMEIRTMYNEIPWAHLMELSKTELKGEELKILVDDKLPKIHQHLIRILDR